MEQTLSSAPCMLGSKNIKTRPCYIATNQFIYYGEQLNGFIVGFCYTNYMQKISGFSRSRSRGRLLGLRQVEVRTKASGDGRGDLWVARCGSSNSISGCEFFLSCRSVCLCLRLPALRLREDGGLVIAALAPSSKPRQVRCVYYRGRLWA